MRTHVGRDENALAVVRVEKPQSKCHPDDDSSRPGASDGNLHAPVGKLGLIVKRIHNSDVALHRYDDQVIEAHQDGHLLLLQCSDTVN